MTLNTIHSIPPQAVLSFGSVHPLDYDPYRIFMPEVHKYSVEGILKSTYNTGIPYFGRRVLAIIQDRCDGPDAVKIQKPSGQGEIAVPVILRSALNAPVQKLISDSLPEGSSLILLLRF